MTTGRSTPDNLDPTLESSTTEQHLSRSIKSQSWRFSHTATFFGVQLPAGIGKRFSSATAVSAKFFRTHRPQPKWCPKRNPCRTFVGTGRTR